MFDLHVLTYTLTRNELIVLKNGWIVDWTLSKETINKTKEKGKENQKLHGCKIMPALMGLEYLATAPFVTSCNAQHS